MTNLKEFWGIMNVLDSADDVALFVVSSRDQKILYCNHLVTVLTGAHTGSDLEKVWDKEKSLIERAKLYTEESEKDEAFAKLIDEISDFIQTKDIDKVVVHIVEFFRSIIF